MSRLSRGILLLLGFVLLQSPAYAQDAAQTEQQAQERKERMQQREARREERQRQIDSLSDEQRQALRERQRIRQARGAGQRGQRPLRRPPSGNSSQSTAESEADEPA